MTPGRQFHQKTRHLIESLFYKKPQKNRLSCLMPVLSPILFRNTTFHRPSVPKDQRRCFVFVLNGPCRRSCNKTTSLTHPKYPSPFHFQGTFRLVPDLRVGPSAQMRRQTSCWATSIVFHVSVHSKRHSEVRLIVSPSASLFLSVPL